MKKRPFEIVVLAGFAGLFVLGLVFVNILGPSKKEPEIVIGSVDIWGTVPVTVFQEVFRDLQEVNDDFLATAYRQIDARSFDDELINAIAEGRGPDLIFIPHTKLVDHLPKLSLIPYENFPLRDFKDLFIDGTEIYLLPEGIAGYPLAIDPLVMYWNRDTLASSGFASAPKTWEEVVNQIVPAIVKRDFNQNILTSPIALGEYRNISNAYEILSALMLQGGSRMVEISNLGETMRYDISLDFSISGVSNPATNALEFYTSFATANNPLYSWNRSQPQDINMFASRDVALYFGMGSEYGDISRLNPNLNFDIAELPQSGTSEVKRTYGDIYALSLLKSSDNNGGALAVMNTFSINSSHASKIATEANFAPVLRNVLSAGAPSPVDRVRYTSALYARGWYNPERVNVETIFKDIVESILSNRSTASKAVRDGVIKLQQEF